MLKSVLFLMMFIFLSNIYANEGALVVSYQTGSNRERLDRVRFRLDDGKCYQKLFPQGKGFFCDANQPHRIVVIDNLPVGQYTVQFLIPNTDGLFEEAPKREITIVAGERVKIDQYLQPRYATIEARLKTCVTDFPLVVMPVMTLKTKSGKILVQSNNGKMLVNNLVPGTYILVFEKVEGYKEPISRVIQVLPGEKIEPIIGLYEPALMSPSYHEEMPPPARCFT